MLENFPAVLHLEKEFYMENKMIPPHGRKMNEFLKSEKLSSIKTIISKILKTKEKIHLVPNQELLGKLKDGVIY